MAPARLGLLDADLDLVPQFGQYGFALLLALFQQPQALTNGLTHRCESTGRDALFNERFELGWKGHRDDLSAGHAAGVDECLIQPAGARGDARAVYHDVRQVRRGQRERWWTESADGRPAIR